MGTQGVLLYYKYIRLDHDGAKERVHGFYSDLCRRLEQKGRVRVAADGVNVTVSVKGWNCRCMTHDSGSWDNS